AHPRLNPEYKADDHKDYDVGSAAHALLLEGLRPFEIISAKDFRTDAAKAARDAAYAAGKIPLLEKQLAPIEEMIIAARRQIEDHD
ncbi:hypothetical protein LAJ55_14510, partial [Streptococcus pneumoniae]|uniref:hypothetical protein n=1 Tax=Streptococcus pneumoniae TaxID=1313 RepID=UPI001CBED87F